MDGQLTRGLVGTSLTVRIGTATSQRALYTIRFIQGLRCAKRDQFPNYANEADILLH